MNKRSTYLELVGDLRVAGSLCLILADNLPHNVRREHGLMQSLVPRRYKSRLELVGPAPRTVTHPAAVVVPAERARQLDLLLRALSPSGGGGTVDGLGLGRDSLAQLSGEHAVPVQLFPRQLVVADLERSLPLVERVRVEEEGGAPDCGRGTLHLERVPVVEVPVQVEDHHPPRPHHVPALDARPVRRRPRRVEGEVRVLAAAGRGVGADEAGQPGLYQRATLLLLHLYL